MRAFIEKLLSLFPNRSEDPEKRYFKTILFLSLGIILLMVVAGLVVFFLAVQAEEQTMVPNLLGMELENALLALEDRALYPSVQLRFSQNEGDKGTILGQDPHGGVSVKAGSRVLLRVSRGSASETMDDFVGWTVDDLEAHLRSLVSLAGPLITVKRPVMSLYHASPEGTILEQKPLPGTEVTQATELELVVSRGPQGQTWTVPSYTGASFASVLTQAARDNVPFVFTSQAPARNQTPGTIISQSPSAGQSVPRETIIMQFVIAEPPRERDRVFGIFERTLPLYGTPVRISAEVVSPGGEVKQLFSMQHPGGLVTIPYLEPENSQIRLLMGDQMPLTMTVRRENP
ncbi:MAG: PASTA domain-containing protein [Spirochaetales bacterium]|jgi:beta-lactam-binding protein with PASTA domain|nr:PASTA domain-containing protein [Spirochaetales bacterium]